MNGKRFKLFLFGLVGLLNTLFIAAQIFLFSTNFKSSPWYDPENLLGMFILLPIMSVIFVILLSINIGLKVESFNAKVLFASFSIYGLELISFDYTIGRLQLSPYFNNIFNSCIILNIVIFCIFILITLLNTAWVIVKVNKKTTVS